jgi:phosphoribosylformylglycinamidine synthase
MGTISNYYIVGEIRICILRIEGTNCEEETYLVFKRLGVNPEIVHLKQLIGDVREEEKRDLFDYNCLIVPGGFSSGDYIRAGAVFAARMKSESTLRKDLLSFVREGYPIGGICNGFQVLIEIGLLPGFDGMSEYPDASLTVNDSSRFECRPTLLKHESPCVFTEGIPRGEIVGMPCAHAEGKFLVEEEYLSKLVEDEQVIFRYVDSDGNYAGYPWNPNGSLYNIAAVCNPSKNVFGMMPHPERVFHGDGKAVFKSVLNYIERTF